MSDINNLIAGTARSTKVAEVGVKLDINRIVQAAEVATTVIMQKYGDALGATRDEVNEVNVVGLQAALMKAADGDANLGKGVFIPCYFDSMIKGLNVKIGRTVVTPSEIKFKLVIPVHYKLTVMKMKAAGIVFTKAHRAAVETSQTLALGRENIDGVECIVGNFSDVDVSDLVRRGLLQTEAKSVRTLKELAGELALNYGELDTLLVDYFAAEAKVSLG